LLGPGCPALVVRELVVVFEALYRPAVFVCGLDPLAVERRGDGVGEAFPVLDFVLAPVYGTAWRTSEVVDSSQDLTPIRPSILL
jgi:hypothetical protein